ncbi:MULTISPECIES: GIY-YIG nuclease family protein [Bacteria]
MHRHARVSWVRDPAPRTAEEELLAAANVPLNVDQHLHDPFSRELNRRRIGAKAAARSEAV